MLTIRPLRPGDDGTVDTLDAMAGFVRARALHPVIAGLARRITGDRSEPRERIAALRGWLADRLTFHPDPPDMEWVDDPAEQMMALRAVGRIHGDCDDAATLGATLARAMGLPSRFVVAGFGRAPAPYEHVWTDVFDGARWHDLDVTRDPTALSPSRRAVYTLDSGTFMPQLIPTFRRSYDPYQSTTYPVTRGPLGYSPYEDTRVTLGFLPAVPVVVATAGKVAAWAGVAKQISGMFGGSKEPDRIRLTDAMFQEAVAGNQVALLYLRQRTGNYGIVDVPGQGQVGGWGSGTAKAYAAQKYQEALRVLGQTGPNLVDVPGVGPVGVPQGVKEAGLPVALAVGIGVLLLTSKRRR